MCSGELCQQEVQKVGHRVKRNVEMRIEKRVTDSDASEEHMMDLVNEINPRGMYENLCRTFQSYVNGNDYSSVLKVYNEKTMVNSSNVAQLCGLKNKDEYVKAVLAILKEDSSDALEVRKAVKGCWGIL